MSHTQLQEAVAAPRLDVANTSVLLAKAAHLVTAAQYMAGVAPPKTSVAMAARLNGDRVTLLRSPHQ
jgi:hypothetical protein